MTFGKRQLLVGALVVALGAAVSRYVKQEWGIECRTVIVS